MIKHNKKYRIALIGDSLANGGAEKVHALLSDYFHRSGWEVHNCIFSDMVVYDYSGSLLNLGTIHPNSNAIIRKATRFWELRKFIKKNRFHAVIDFRMRPGFGLELALSKCIYPHNTLYTVHSSMLDFYFPKSTLLAKLLYRNKKIVAVSKGIQNLISEKGLAQNVIQIYNPLHLKTIEVSKEAFELTEDRFVLAVGRMNHEVKQFDKLISAYAKSVLPAMNIPLVFLGEGDKQLQYQGLARQLGVDSLVRFKGFVDNPFPYYQKALFTVLSSKKEGFPNVIIESLAVGTPVVSFDCFSGPNEIIIDKENGLLVADQNFEKLTEAMNLLAVNENVYQDLKRKAQASIAQFDLEIIGQQWSDLLKKTVS